MKNKLLTVLPAAEQFALYGLPDFDDGQRLAFLSLSEKELDHGDDTGLCRSRHKRGYAEFRVMPSGPDRASIVTRDFARFALRSLGIIS